MKGFLHIFFVAFFLFTFSDNLLLAQEVADDCEDAIVITDLDGTCNTYTEFDSATFDFTNGNCSPPSAANVWFSFTAQGPNATIEVNPTANGPISVTLVTLPNGCGNSGNQIGCNKQSPLVVQGLTAGTTYYVILTQESSTATEIEICITNPPPPPNDDPCSATTIPNNGCVDGTTLGADADYQIPGCPNNNVQNAVFFSYTLGPLTTGLEINVGSYGITGGIGMALLVFPNGCTGTPTLASNNSTYCGNPPATVTFDNLTPGTTVYLMIGSSLTGAGTIENLCVTEIEGDPPCDTNISCNDAIEIVIPNTGETVCTPGCNIGMPDGGFTNCGGAFTNPTAWYSFNTGPNNTVVFETVNGDLTSLTYALMADCNSIIACNPLTESLLPNTTYYVAVGDTEGNTGNFELCITLLNITAPCITNETFQIIGASMGSPIPDGPFRPGETLTFSYSTAFIATAPCQWIHSFIPYMSDCWNNQTPQMTVAPSGTNIGGNINWYPASTIFWKPTTNNPPSALGIDAQGKLCLIGTQGCMNFTGGGQCSATGTPMPAGWVVTNNSGTCGSSAPNLSWGISQGCGSTQTKSLQFTLTIPDNACSCDDDEEGYVVGMASFPDGATGGYAEPSCNGNGMIKRFIPIECCTPPTMVMVNGITCSNVTFFADITLDPSNSTISWTVLNANGVSGATSGSGSTFSQTLNNTTGSTKVVTYAVTPISPTGCEGEPQTLSVTVYPAVIADAGPDKTSCPGATITLGGNPTASGGAGAPYTIEWSNGETTNTIEVTPSINSTYTVTVTDASGCTATDQVAVNVSGQLEVTIEPNPAVFCVSEVFGNTLTANTNGTNAPFTYKWTTPWGTQTTQTININYNLAGTYQITVEVTDAIGCVGVGVATLTLHSDPYVLILDEPVGPLCPQEPYVISSSPLSIDGTVYSSNPPGFITFDGTILTDQMTPGDVYWFYATYTDPNTGCTGKDSFQTTTILLEDPVINQVGPYCANDPSQIQLEGTPAGGTWSGSATSNGLFLPATLGPGSHEVFYTIGTGTCTKTTSIYIQVNPIPQPNILNLSAYCINETPNPILVSDIPNGVWSSPINNFGEIPLNSMGPGSYPFTYTVEVDGCEGTVEGIINISDQPTANVTPVGVVCNADPGDDGKSKLDLDDFITSGNTSGTWVEQPPLSGAVHLGGNEYDFTGIANGTVVTFVYTVPAALPCTDFVATVTITVDDDCDCPKMLFNTPAALCNDAAVLDLNSLEIDAESGDWTLINVPTGSNPGTLIGSQFNATGKDAGVYTVRFTLNPAPSNEVCAEFIELTITVHPEVVFNMRPELSACNIVPVPSDKTKVNLDDFFIGSSVPGSWTNDDGVGINEGGNVWDFTGVPVGTYTFTFTTNNAIAPCANKTQTVSVEITDNCDCPELSVLVPTTTVCDTDNNSIDLNTKISSAEPGSWRLISDPSGPVNNPIAGGIFSSYGQPGGTYTFEFEIGITPPENCDSTVTVNVVIESQVVYSLSPTATVCNTDPQGEDANLLDFSGTSVWNSAVVPGTWVDTDNSGAVANGSIWDFTGVPVGTYTFTFTPTGVPSTCPVIPQTIEITVTDNCACEDLPTLNAIADACNEMMTITLVNPGGTTGTWSFTTTPTGSNPAVINGNTIDIDGKDEGTYTLQYLFDNIPAGCPNTASTSFNLFNYRFAGRESDVLSYCEGTVLIIDIMDFITGEDPGGTITEVGPNTAGAALNGSILRITDLTAGHYIFEYSFAQNGVCEGTKAEVEVIINENPIADAGADQLLTCESPSATIGGTPFPGTNIVYTWTEISGHPIPNPNQLINSVTLDGTYTLTVENTVTGCRDTDVIVITSDPDRPSNITIERDGPRCYGYNDGYIRISNITGGAEPILYSFNGGPYSSINSWNNLSGSNNTIKIKDANGCELTLSDIILIEPPLVSVQLGADTIINLGDTVLIDPVISIPDTSIASITFSSDFDFINCTGCFDITVFPNQTTVYSVEVKDKNGCSDSDDQKIIVKKGVNIFVPNIFTPNGDGNNDKVMISTNEREIKNINSFQIYDRWGEKMYEAFNFQPNDHTKGWDGTLKGQECNPAVYVYWAEVELFDGTKHIIKGDVTLLR